MTTETPTVPDAEERSALSWIVPLVFVVVVVAMIVLGGLAATDRWVFAPDDPCAGIDDCPTFGT